MHHKLLNVLKNNHVSNNESDNSVPNGTPSASLTASYESEWSDNDEGSDFHLDNSPLVIPDPLDDTTIDGAELASLIAQYGHAPATAWVESARYRIWRPSKPIPQSSFIPIQGYLHTKGWIFAWGGPLVSDEAALEPALAQFIAWVKSRDLRLVYCCVPKEIEELLGGMGWPTVGCISEDIIDPQHILEMTREDDGGGHGSMVKDLKKNLRRAGRANVEVKHITRQEWSHDLKSGIEDGIEAWKQARNGRWQLAATSFDPWIDSGNREYWVALQNGQVVGVLVLTRAGDSYVIKNAAQFPNAPKGTSEQLIHTALRNLYEQHLGVEGHDSGHLTVTFNISAANDLKCRNISGWKITWLRVMYSKVVRVAHLMNRHDFRRKFDASAKQMFVCYPSEDGFGKDGIDNLLKLLQH